MQFIYLRGKSSAKNPGRHPFGMIGVQRRLTPDPAIVSYAVLILHSEDRFEKEKGRKLLAKKLATTSDHFRDNGSGTTTVISVRSILPKHAIVRLADEADTDYAFNRILHDEAGLPLPEGLSTKARIARDNHAFDDIAAIIDEHGCAP